MNFFCIALAMFLLASSTYGSNKVVVKEGMNYQKVFAGKNTEYVIEQDIDLRGKIVKIGKGSTLVFRGGSLANGTVYGNKTIVEAANYEIFKRGSTRYRAYKTKDASENSHPSLKIVYHNSVIIKGTWGNWTCGTNWTGLLNSSNEDVMLAVRNYTKLHLDGARVVFPTFTAKGYESTELPGNHVIDFNNSTISYPDYLSVWEDSTIALPQGAISCPMESGYGLISTNNNTTIANLSIDGKSMFRQNEVIRLGVSCIISIGSAKNVVFKNVSLTNVLGPAITAQAGAKNLTFWNCHFYNIGEHVIYSHQYQGYCHFQGCYFDTWDSERISVHRNGMDYIYKHTPPIDGVSYDTLYQFDLSFTDCQFNNPCRIDSRGRTLGGFLTGSFPLVVKLNSCKFTGVFPPLNPGGGSMISEKSGKCFRMIVRDCEGAPYVYPSKANYNIVMEFYNCTDIPFRTVYARRYEDCKLYLDLYEDNIENVSSSFEAEFSQPLFIRNCDLIDGGRDVKINHPVLHRPITFERCSFMSDVKRTDMVNVVTLKTNRSLKIIYRSCDINLPGFRLADEQRVVSVQE